MSSEEPDMEALTTRLIHGGEPADASAVAIHPANAYADHYSRHTNPTVEALEAKVRELEGGAFTVATATGMAAVSQTLLGLLRQGDRLVVHRRIFIGVRTLLEDFLPHYGIEVVAVDLNDPGLLARALEAPATAAVYFETLSNPHIEVVDAPAVLAAVRRAGVLSLVDNTLLTPCLFRPLEHGADVVIHSASKYIGGHGDALGGVVTLRDPAQGEQVLKARRILGGMLSPHNAYLLQRGLKTLPMRMERHCASALRVAAFLDEHPRVRKVNHPSLASSPDHARAASFLKRFGGLMSLELADREEQARFLGALRLCKVRFSFGEPGTTLLAQDWTEVTRLSVGLESPEEIVADLAQALETLG
jgi:methionine-gamma-lyase